MESFGKPLPYHVGDRNSREYILRIERRRNIFDRLSQEGKLAVLGLGSILYARDEYGNIPRLKEYVGRRTLFWQSQIVKNAGKSSARRFFSLQYEDYTRLEEAFQSFMKAICLSVENLNDNEVLIDFDQLKLWCFKHGSESHRIDQVIEYLKYLIKYCQALFLKTELPEEKTFFPKRLFPFKNGPFKFISELGSSPSQRRPLTLAEAHTLAQVCAGNRSLPYPSSKQIQKSILDSLSLITEKKTIAKSAIIDHKIGLSSIVNRLGNVSRNETHISLTNSGCADLPKSEGGRGLWLTSNAKKFCNIPLNEENLIGLIDLQDHFGDIPVSKLSAALIYNFMENHPEEKRTLGQVLYLQPIDVEVVLSKNFQVPKNLGKIILLESSREILSFGRFSEPIQTNCLGVPLFKRGRVISFNPDVESINVTASLSIEASLKTRLVTAAPACFTTIGQAISNPLREYLSQDPFLRVGFDEPDKLWEVLKEYRKRKASKDEYIISLDLTEATYNIGFDVIEANLATIEVILKDFRPWKTYSKLFYILKRNVNLTEIKRQGYLDQDYPDSIMSQTGSFMGDSLSFIHLTMTLSSLVSQVTALDHGKRISRHVFENTYIERPLGQSVGDDLLVIGVSEYFCISFRERVLNLGLKTSKIDAYNTETFTFCEQYGVRNVLGEPTDHLGKDSVFGDLIYLDIIKGSLLTGKPKVKADHSDAFIGQAKMLKTQIEYIPFKWKAIRARVILWSTNYRKSIKLGRAKPHFPELLGGLSIAVGACDTWDSKIIKSKYRNYLYGMLELPKSEFLKNQILLSGIFRGSPKGFPWSNDEEKLAIITSQCEFISEEEVFSRLPPYFSNKGVSEKLRYISHNLGLITVSQLVDELARRESFLSLWMEKKPPSYVTLKLEDCVSRHNCVWNQIRQNVEPVEPKWPIDSFKKLQTEFQIRTWGLFVSRESPAIAEAYDGTPSLHIKI